MILTKVIFRTNWDRQNHWELEGPLTQGGSLERTAFLKPHRGENFDSTGSMTTIHFYFPHRGSADTGSIIVLNINPQIGLRLKPGNSQLPGRHMSYCFYDEYLSNHIWWNGGATPPTHIWISFRWRNNRPISMECIRNFLRILTLSRDEYLVGLGSNGGLCRQRD